jgi:hypothetical protein
MKKIDMFGKEFNTKKELLAFIVENKDTLIAQKKAELKKADAIMCSYKNVNKANSPVDVNDKTELKIIAIINTTNLMDSHDDVHMPGIWTKSLQENKNIMHLQEHKMEFDKIISDGEDLNPYVKFFTWRELGFDYEGQTQALVFESNIKKERNPYMFNQYASGFVKQHSVGMRYIKLLLAVDDEDWPEHKEIWDKYINEVANRELAEDKGFFYAVKEAKIIEGSAVPLGSNTATPTLDNNAKSEFEEQLKILQDLVSQFKEPNEPVTSTLDTQLDFLKSLKENL